MSTYRIPPAKITQAKNFSCVDILDYFNHTPVLEKSSGELVYFSPFRNERTPSFYVNRKENVFYDHGDSDKKGDAISLYRFMSGKSFQTAIYELTENKINTSKNDIVRYETIKTKQTGIEAITILPEVRNQNLILYAESRGINSLILNTFCGEIKYKQLSTGKFYSSIAFKNDSEGFELRSAGFKSCYGTKDITTISGSSELLIFEGFFNFLSFCQMHTGIRGRTVIVLNTLANLRKVDFLPFSKVFYFFDNDKAGEAAKAKMPRLHENSEDWSRLYFGYNDLNERLIANLQNQNG